MKFGLRAAASLTCDARTKMSHTVHMSVDPPGLRGLNRLARKLNELNDSGRITSWKISHRLLGTQDKYLVRFESAADAQLAQDHAARSSPC
jgi:hypothetical protein